MNIKTFVLNSLTILIISTFGNTAACNTTGTIVPLYIYPQVINNVHNWQPLINAHSSYPIEVWAIVNVNNGPSTNIDASYKDGIKRLKTAGIHTLGYVRTNYTVRSITDVKNDIAKWKSLYNPEGIFFDEMTNDNNNGHITYYTNVGTYAKSQGFTYTVGNPGTDVPMNYVGILDTIMIDENKTGFPNQNKICGWHQNYPRKQWGIFPYNIPSLNENQILEAKKCVGFIYVTNDNGDNPWDTLPPYLNQLFQLLQKPL